MSISIDRVLLNWPTLLSSDAAGTRWHQVAKTGSFVSKRYGKFSITKDDLKMMLHNFNEVTPTAPTELPIDYDHLSMSPQKPGDGKAAGWFKGLELREDGNELWAQVEWTPPAAESIKNKEYRFISPSFVKNHTHKDGKSIGTTLLAAAITNHPFLEGMDALTLSADNIGDVAVADQPMEMSMTKGQRVMIKPGQEQADGQAGQTYQIAEVIGEGNDAFVALQAADGVVHKWFRAAELAPAMMNEPQQAPFDKKLEEEAAAALKQPDAAVAAADPAAAAAAVAGTPAEQLAKAVGDAAVVAVASKIAGGDATAAPPAADEDAAEDAAEEDKPEGEKKPSPFGAKPKEDGAAAEAKPGAEAKPAAESDDEKKKNPFMKNLSTILQRGHAMSTVYTLRDDKGTEIKLSSEQILAAVQAEGQVIMPAAEVDKLKSDVTNLSSQVTNLAATAEASLKREKAGELKQRLDALMSGGFITRSIRQWAEKTWGESIDLAAFNEWAATQTVKVMSLDTEHGSGREAVEQPGDNLMTLAADYASKNGVGIREALIKVSAANPDVAERYQDSFRPQA